MSIKTITVKLADATDAQLRQFASDHLGLTLQSLERGAPLRAKIQAAWDKDEITLALPDAPAALQTGAAPTPADAPAEAERMVTILIQKTDDAEGAQPVWVSVNGRGMFIERGKPQTIKERFLKALQNAVRTVYAQPDGATGEMVATEVPSYPYSIIS
jgi:hypothetical protein